MSFIVYNEAFEKKYNLALFNDFLNTIIEEGSFADFCFVLATNRLVNHLKLQTAKLLFERKQKPLVDFQAMNLESLVRLAFNFFYPKDEKKVISDSFRFVLFEEAYEVSDLEFYPKAKEKKNLFLIKWLSEIVFGLKEDGIRPQQMADELEISDNRIISKSKFKDTFVLYQKYEEILRESGFVDKIDLFEYVNKRLKQYLEEVKAIYLPFIMNGKTMLFYGYYDFKQPEIEFLNIIKDFHNPVAIFLDFDEKNGPLFGNYIQILRTFISCGYQAKDLSSNAYRKGQEPNSTFIRKYLFNNYEHLTNPNLADFIQIYSAENRYDEVKYIVRLCKYLIKIKGVPPKDICIVTKNPGKYSSIFREAFNDAEIPANITERFKLNTSPLVISVLLALSVVVKGYRYSDIRKVLQSYYFEFYRILPDGRIEHFDLENFLFVVNTLKLIGGEEFGGKKYWELRFQSRIDYLEQRRKNLCISSFDDETELFELENSIKKIKKAYDDMLMFFSYFDFENIEYTPQEFYNIVFDKIIRKFGVLKKLSEVIDTTFQEILPLDRFDKIKRIEEIERDSRALICFIKLLEELVFVLNQRFPNQKVKLSKFLEYLKLMVFDERFQISRKENYGVTVTTIEQTRGIPFRVMILCGMVDGEFPLRYNPEIFLGKELKKTETRHFENERLEFFFFLNNAPYLLDKGEKLIYIFYPKSDSKREFVPSFFLNYLTDLVGERKSEIIVDINALKNNPLWLESSRHSWLNYFASQKDSKLLRFDFLDVRSYFDHEDFEVTKLTSQAKEYLRNLTKAPISASFLEEYVKCPFKFFVRRILSIREPIEQFDFFLSNLEKGLIMHYVVANFYRELSHSYQDERPLISVDEKMKFVPIKLIPQQKESYLSLLRNKTAEILNRFDSELAFFEIDRSEFLGSEEGKLGLIPLWLNYELSRFANIEWKYMPTIFELQFGMGKTILIKPIEIKNENGEILFTLKGKIDRIDFYFPVELENSDPEVLITDYKLKKGECRKLEDALKGKTFQMPLYAFALEVILKEYFKLNNFRIKLIYQIFDYVLDEKSKKADNLQIFYEQESKFEINENANNKSKNSYGISYEEFKKRMIENVMTILNRISKEPSFPVKPLNQSNTCNYCNFKFICKKVIF